MTSPMVPIIITGAAGRMGQTLVAQTVLSDKYQLVGVTEFASSSAIGQDAGQIAGVQKVNISVVASLTEAIKNGTKIASGVAPVVIDFTQIDATLQHVEQVIRSEIPLVIGTTGFSADQRGQIEKAAKKIPIVMAPNMSVGVNTLFKLIGDAAKILGEGFDLEVVEAHHRLKKDAPSGTAVRIGEILAETTGRNYPKDAQFHREGLIGERSSKEIGMQVIRGGDIVGEHTVMYCGAGERLEIKHVATSRKTFADGALRAAAWLVDRKAGLYDMQDVLGIGARD